VLIKVDKSMVLKKGINKLQKPEKIKLRCSLRLKRNVKLLLCLHHEGAKDVEIEFYIF
jgi:hypothetical protein